jgi:quercetin dioxygenase-like cupin family protein
MCGALPVSRSPIGTPTTPGSGQSRPPGGEASIGAGHGRRRLRLESCSYPTGIALLTLALGQGMKGAEVPIINKQDVPTSAGAAPGLETCILVGVEQGSHSLHIEEVTVAPQARIPRRIHPHTEVAIIVLEGRLDALLGRQRMTIGPGHTVLAPAGTAHGFLNRYAEPARVLLVFPAHQVEHVLVSVPGATSGFVSEKGLSGYASPQDRPLEKGR